MNQREIKNFCKNQGINLFFLRLIGRGNNYILYRGRSRELKDFVIKLPISRELNGDRLEREFRILQFLNYAGIKFAPKPISYFASEQISLISYVPGKLTGVSKLNKKQREIFISQVFELHKISYSRYLIFCKKYKYKPEGTQLDKDRIRIFGRDRFKVVEKYGYEKELIDWIKPRLLDLEKNINRGKVSNVIFNHRDLAGSNLIVKGNSITFIDWDMAAFMEAEDYWLGYIFLHDDGFTASKKQIFITEYSKKLKVKEDVLISRIKKQQKIVSLLGIIWALYMFSEYKRADRKGEKKFLRLSRQRINEYKKFLNDNEEI